MYTYGVIGNHDTPYSHEPYTPPGLENHFLTDIQASPTYNVALNETGEVYVYDNCSEITRLPMLFGTKIAHVATFASQVYGIDVKGSTLYKWSFGMGLQAKTMVFRLAKGLVGIEGIEVVDGTIGLAYRGDVCEEPVGELVGQLAAYRHQSST